LLTGDDLTVQLFVGGTAVAVLSVAMTQAGWTHKWFVRSLFVVAALLIVVAIFWKSIEGAIPKIGPIASDVAGSSVSWFTLLLTGFGIVFFLDFRARTRGFADYATPPEDQKDDKKSENKIIEPPLERSFVKVTPEYLMDFYKDRTSFQGDQLAKSYIGKWIRISGKVANVDVKQLIHVSVRLPDTRHIILVFDNDWEDRVSILIGAQKIEAIGQISQVNEIHMTLRHCEVID
jgi:hypothetical protein